jgi:Heterokaryon incompatibility protein (HET)
MWSIYSKAARVLVWLGPEQDDSYSGMEMVKLLSLRYKLDMRQKIEWLERRMNEEQRAESEKADGSQRIEEKGEAVPESPTQGRINMFWMSGEYRMCGGPPESNFEHDRPSSKSKATSEPKNTGEGEDEEKGKPITDEDRLADIPFFMLYKLLSYENRTDENVPTMWLAFQKLMERPWWRRVWVIQEVAAAKNSILVGCGTYWID